MACVVKWFYKSENSFPMGLTLTIRRACSFVNDVLSPRFSGETKDEDGFLNAINALNGDVFKHFFINKYNSNGYS